MANTIFSLKAHSFRTLPTPLDSQEIRTYHCVVPVHEIPEEFFDWMEVNAREPSLKGRVPKAIRTTLNESPELFVAYNRGLAILAKAVEYDNKSKVIKLTFKDKECHGIFDGGHTLKVILDERNNSSTNTETNEQEDAYCRLEIITGLPEDIITDIVDARNTSKQVASKSLLNLEGRFSELKKLLGSKISNQISWYENEDAPIDVREVIALLTSVDRTHYDDTKHPLVAYSGKEACLKHFQSSPDCYKKIYSISKDILKIYELIQAYVPQQYNSPGEKKFGKLKGCQKLKKPQKLGITGETVLYEFPNAYLYPIVAAFRSMLIEENGVYVWGKNINPCKLVREGLANKIFSGSVVNSIKDYHNPNRTGKDTNVWALAYQIAENYFLRI